MEFNELAEIIERYIETKGNEIINESKNYIEALDKAKAIIDKFDEGIDQTFAIYLYTYIHNKAMTTLIIHGKEEK